MAVYGGVPMEPQSRALTAGVPFVVATPGRLMDHMRSGTAAFNDLEVLVLDEADRMLDMGFWPDVRRIVEALPADAADTALLGDDAGRDHAASRTRSCASPAFVQVGKRGGPARTITHAVENVADRREDRLAGAVPARRSRVRCSSSCAPSAAPSGWRGSWPASGIRAAALHADRSQKERMSAVEGFRAGRYRVLVATDIAARGLDIDGITHVVNYDVPHTPEAYVHRVGRTGRALATGTAVTLVSPGEERALRAIADRVPLSA